jgi:hypothetical protein
MWHITPGEFAEGVRTGFRELEEAVQKVPTRAGQLVAAEFKRSDRRAAERCAEGYYARWREGERNLRAVA